MEKVNEKVLIEGILSSLPELEKLAKLQEDNDFIKVLFKPNSLSNLLLSYQKKKKEENGEILFKKGLLNYMAEHSDELFMPEDDWRKYMQETPITICPTQGFPQEIETLIQTLLRLLRKYERIILLLINNLPSDDKE
ncbi:MAG: hypothetical protein IKQ07_03205 [Bacteroidaceae bacterium]|nr:hypothetical protein [Bacteroidaceae bacterium]